MVIGFYFLIPFCRKHEHNGSAMTPNRTNIGNKAAEETEQKNISRL